MRKINSVFAAVLALVMLAGLGACVGGGDSGSPGNGSNVPSDDANEIRLTNTEGLLIMATSADFPPYEFYEGGQIVGIDAEIAGAIAEKLGLELRIDDMDFGAIIPAITSGRADIGMAGMTVRPDREENVNFSVSYATGVQVVVVREGSEITSVDDLFEVGAHFDIAVQEATTGDIYATDDLEDEGLATIHRFRRGGDAILALTSGRVDCVIIDNEPAKAFIESNSGLVILDTEYAVEDYAIAIGKDNNTLLEAVNNALHEIKADGTAARIVNKYITAD